MASVLNIRLFGELFVAYDDQPPITSLYPARLQNLLAYLLLYRAAPQPRTHLAYLFWPESSEFQALTNLRNLFHLLRQAFPSAGSYLLSDRHTLQWRPGLPYRLDVEDFERDLNQAAQALSEDDLPACAAATCRAVDQYSDDLLLSCYADWILPERERLRSRLLEGLDFLIAYYQDLGSYSRSLTYAKTLLRFDPLRESIYRRIMELHALQGDRAGVLQAYQACSDLLQQELSIQPSEVTRQAFERLVHAGSSAAVYPVPELRIPKHPLRPQVWSQVQAAWDGASAGHPACLLISGEAGSGKTHLLSQVEELARSQGAETLHAVCYSGEGELAFSPVTAWLRSRPLHPLGPAWQAEINRLLPVPHLKPIALVHSQAVFEALAHALLPEDRPVLLLLDNLQWSDSTTLEWLRFLLHYLPQARLLIAAALRPEHLPDRPALRLLLQVLRENGQLIEAQLLPLNYTETTSLAEDLSGASLSLEAAGWLYQETEGNPLMVAEILQHNGAHPAFPAACRSLPLADAMLRSRLEALSPAARRLVYLACAVCHPVDGNHNNSSWENHPVRYELLLTASGMDEATLVDALDELVQRCVLRESGANDYVFTHHRLAQAADEEVSAARRRLLTQAVQAALETLA